MVPSVATMMVPVTALLVLPPGTYAFTVFLRARTACNCMLACALRQDASGGPPSTRQDGRPLSIEQERQRPQREQEDCARTHDRQPRHHWTRASTLLEMPGDLARMPCEQHGRQTHEQ